MNLKSMWNAAVNYLRKLPVARYIRPLWKGGLKMAVQEGGDELQAKVKAEVAKDILGAGKRINPIIDKAQARIQALARAVPLPAVLRAKVQVMLGQGIDDLQEQLEDAIESGSHGAVNAAIDAAFDRFQAQLIARIDAL